jgi:HK97 family phage major capsid protein
MSIAEQIVKAEADLVQTKDALTESTVALEAAPEEESLLLQVEELSEKVEMQTKRLAALHKAEGALALRARPAGEGTEAPAAPVAPGAPAVITNLGYHKLKAGGELIWKHATAELLAHMTKRDPYTMIQELYPDDERVLQTFKYIKSFNSPHAKSAVNPATTTTATWAAELVRHDTRGFVESLFEVSVASSLAPETMLITFDGFGSIAIPIENPLPAAPSEPAWVGEGGAIPLTQYNFGSQTLIPYKLGAITTMTNEIMRRSTPAIEGIVSNLLTKAYGKVLDNAFLATGASGAAVAGLRPASILNGVAPLPAATGSPDLNVRADIYTLLAPLISSQIGSKPILLLNRLNVTGVGMLVNALGETVFADVMSAKNILGIPFIMSNYVPMNTVIMVDAAYLATAFGAIEFNVSDVAAITEANADTTPPTQADDGTGVVGTVGQVPHDAGIKLVGSTGAASAGYTARSLWQTWSTGLRLVAETSWAKLNPAAAQYIVGVKWAQ